MKGTARHDLVGSLQWNCIRFFSRLSYKHVSIHNFHLFRCHQIRKLNVARADLDVCSYSELVRSLFGLLMFYGERDRSAFNCSTVFCRLLWNIPIAKRKYYSLSIKICNVCSLHNHCQPDDWRHIMFLLNTENIVLLSNGWCCYSLFFKYAEVNLSFHVILSLPVNGKILFVHTFSIVFRISIGQIG